MSRVDLIAEEFRSKSHRGQYRALYGMNRAAADLFRAQVKAQGVDTGFLLLCRADGLILYFRTRDGEDDALPGFSAPMSYLQGTSQELEAIDALPGYVILTTAAAAQGEIAAMLPQLTIGLEVLRAGEAQFGRLLRNLDFVGNSISIFDRNMRLMYANKSWYDDFHISDHDGPIGMTFTELAQAYGLHFHNFEKVKDQFKMYEVLEEGKPALDWEVRLEIDGAPEGPRLISNDMYPTRDEEGRVSGLIEITRSRQQTVQTVRKVIGLAAEYTFDDIVGTSSIMQERIHTAKEYAKSSYSVLITGESGVGKELFAQAIHNHSPRRKGPFVAINCANFPENLIESELFGYVEGAFTGASKKGNMGKFELADQGTIFLDEIGELPFHFQSKLLRVLETMTVTRIGSTKPIPIDVRVVAATNRNLEEMVAQGFFRGDLYFRLQVLNVEIPPLRDRKEDLLVLSQALLGQIQPAEETEIKEMSEGARQVIQDYDWPGNVRELRNVLSRAEILSHGGTITEEVMRRSIHPRDQGAGAAQIASGARTAEPEMAGARHEEAAIAGTPKQEPDKMHANDAPASAQEADGAEENYRRILHRAFADAAGDAPDMTERIEEARREFEHSLLQEILDYAGGNRKQAAKLLGVSRSTFYRLLDKAKGDGPTAGEA